MYRPFRLARFYTASKRRGESQVKVPLGTAASLNNRTVFVMVCAWTRPDSIPTLLLLPLVIHMRNLGIPAFEYEVYYYVRGAFILILDTPNFTLATVDLTFILSIAIDILSFCNSCLWRCVRCLGTPMSLSLHLRYVLSAACTNALPTPPSLRRTSALLQVLLTSGRHMCTLTN